MTRNPSPLLRPVGAPERSWRRLLALVGLSLAGVLLVSLALGAVAAALNWPLDLEAATLDGQMTTLLWLGASLGLIAVVMIMSASVAYGRAPSSFLWPEGFRPGLVLGGMLTMIPALVVAGLTASLLAAASGEPTDMAAPTGAVFSDIGVQAKLAFAAAALVGLMAAALAEEAVFRGLLLQLMGAWIRQPAVIVTISALVFSAIHFDPDPVAFGIRAVLGATWAYAALRLGGIEFGLGLHFASNFALTLLTPVDELVQVGRETPWQALAGQVVAALVVVAVVEAVARRRARPSTP